jgi:ATP-dependent DNA ligase
MPAWPCKRLPVNRRPLRGIVEARYDGAPSPGSITDKYISKAVTGNNLTDRFPDIAAGLSAAIGRSAGIVDGELITPSRGGRPNFNRLQRRLRVTGASTLRQREVLACFYVFWV